MYTIEIGPLSLSLHKTVRVATNIEGAANLPPSLGNFEIFKVSDFPNSPKHWDKEGCFIAMHSKEAMWIIFQTCVPVAVMVGAGKINALDGKSFGEKLEKDNYLVTPPQPWLDGWKGDDGSVYQFVATEVGENKTIGEQLRETKDHAILLSVFEAKNPEKFKTQRFCEEGYESSVECCSMMQFAAGSSNLTCEMGLGKGGKITQKIYEDPYGIEEWKECATKTVKIYLINASEFSEVTGRPLPPSPITEESYDGIWFGLEDQTLKDIQGTKIFDKLKDVV